MHSREWTGQEAVPDDNDQISAGAGGIRNHMIDVRERMVLDHIFASSTSTDGYHTTIHLQGRGANPTAVASYMLLFAKTGVSGGVELYVVGSGTQVTQISKNGYVYLDASVLGNNVYLVASNSAGTGNVNVIKVDGNNLLVTGTNFSSSILVTTTAVASAQHLIPRGALNRIVDGTTLTATTGDSAQLYVANSGITTAQLKTASGEVNGISTTQVLPGGEFGFYPQLKGNSISDVRFSFTDITLTSTYTTYIFCGTGGGAVYAQQRYMTASSEDMWIFLLLDKNTKEIISGYQAPDHPAYGNGGDFDKLPHPFISYNTTKHEIVLLDKSTCNQLKLERKTSGKSILTLINEEYKVNINGELKYEPLHSGKYVDDDSGEQVRVMVTSIPDYIKVRNLIRK